MAETSKGDTINKPLKLNQKIRHFKREFDQDPQTVRNLLYARRYTRWLVTCGPRISVAPLRYAMFADSTFKTLLASTGEYLTVHNAQEEATIEQLHKGSRFSRAVAAVQKLTGRVDDDLTIYRPRQRCLYSGDSTIYIDEFKKWSQLGFKSPANRLNSRDDVVRLEERKRTHPEALRVIRDVIEQQPRFGLKEGLFERGHHFRLVYRSQAGQRYVFVPRHLSLENLHEVARDILSECLEYRFRYNNDPTISFVALLSDEVSKANRWVVGLLNTYKIIVVHRSDHDSLLHIVGRSSIDVRDDLFWMSPKFMKVSENTTASD